MSDKSELKAELERKKQRIAQIREEKKRKEEEKKKKDVSRTLAFSCIAEETARPLLCFYSVLCSAGRLEARGRVGRRFFCRPRRLGPGEEEEGGGGSAAECRHHP